MTRSDHGSHGHQPTKLDRDLTDQLRAYRDDEIARSVPDRHLVDALDALIRSYGTYDDCAAGISVFPPAGGPAYRRVHCGNGFGHLGQHMATADGLSIWWDAP